MWRKRSIWILVAVLAFMVGINSSSLRRVMFSHRDPRVLTLQIPATPVARSLETKRTYQSEMHASGLAGKYEACFGHFSSSDGMNFSSTNIYFDSPRQAQRELQKRLKKVLEIVSREKSLDETGQVVGEQVLATFPPYGDASTPSAQLLLTKGSDFVSISSSS